MVKRVCCTFPLACLLLTFLPLGASINGEAPEEACICNRIHECFRPELCTCRRPVDDDRACLCTEPGNPFWATCDRDTTCCGDPDDIWARHLRAATTLSSLKGDDEDTYRAAIHRCGDHDYDTHIYVEKHLYAVASPGEDARKEGCPYIVTHAVFGNDENPDSPARKEILVWNEEKEQMGKSPFSEESITAGMLPMGTYQLSLLAEAVEKADPSPRGAYDIVTNNCGSYMVNLASELGLKIDARVTSFVARRLLAQSGKALVDRVRQSMNYSSLFHGRHLRSDTVGDSELVQLLVESHTSQLY